MSSEFFQLLQVLSLMTATLCVIAVVILAIKIKKDGFANGFLLIFVAIRIVPMIPGYFLWEHNPQINLDLVNSIEHASIFLYGPLMYLWVKESIFPSISPARALTGLLAHSLLFWFMLWALLFHHFSFAFDLLLFRFLVHYHVLFYLVGAMYLLFQHKNRLFEKYADWPIRHILPAFFVVGLFIVVTIINSLFWQGWLGRYTALHYGVAILRGSYTQALVVFIIVFPSLAAVYRGIPAHFSVGASGDTTGDVVGGDTEINVTEDVSGEGHVRRTDVDTAQAVSAKLNTMMEEDKLYLDPQLNLQKLADLLDVTIAQVSEIINRTTGKNFYEYVNAYRIEHATTMIKEDIEGELKLKTVCFDSGFNNRSSFNNAFKKILGQTPSDYRENILVEI